MDIDIIIAEQDVLGNLKERATLKVKRIKYNNTHAIGVTVTNEELVAGIPFDSSI